MSSTIEQSSYSSSLLDSNGSFNPQKFVVQYLNAIAREKVNHQGMSNSKFHPLPDKGPPRPPYGQLPVDSQAMTAMIQSNPSSQMPLNSFYMQNPFSNPPSPYYNGYPPGSCTRVKSAGFPSQSLMTPSSRPQQFNSGTLSPPPPIPSSAMSSYIEYPRPKMYGPMSHSTPTAQSYPFIAPNGHYPKFIPPCDQGSYHDMQSYNMEYPSEPPYWSPESKLEAISSSSSSSSLFDENPVPSRFSQPQLRHRLRLVVDLDNTLLHACARAKINGCDIPLKDFVSPEGHPELFRFILPRIPDQIYYVKLRPGLKDFLARVSKYCDLAIHTNATRDYAEVVLALLSDEERKLFGTRIAARDDETSKHLKKNMDRLFGENDDLDYRNLVILDDRKDIWDIMYQGHIIHCGMYDYLDSRRQSLIQKYSTIGEKEKASMEPTPISDQTGSQTTDESETTTSEDTPATEESPFSDNPLVQLSSEAHGDEECEDDDIVAPSYEQPVNIPNAHQSSSEIETVMTDTNSHDSREPTSDDPATTPYVAEESSSPLFMNETLNEFQRLSAQLAPEDEELVDYDCQLAYVADLIRDLAIEYDTLCSDPETADRANIADLLQEKRSNILKGTVFQTAGMYKSELSHPEFGWHDNGPVHRRRLVNLGAVVIESFPIEKLPPITHLLAMRATQSVDRIRRERGNQVKYVHALWLHACESTWHRIPEDWFEAMQLLKKYQNNPPKKPWVDHWKVLAMHREELPSRLLQAVENAQKESTAESQTLVLKKHSVEQAKYQGAQIWTPTEQIFLTYDPVQFQAEIPPALPSGRVRLHQRKRQRTHHHRPQYNRQTAPLHSERRRRQRASHPDKFHRDVQKVHALKNSTLRSFRVNQHQKRCNNSQNSALFQAMT